VKRQTILTLLIIVISIALVGCSGSNGTNSGETKSGETKTSETKPAETEKKVDFPKDDIRIILPASPGGGFDTMGRMLASVWPDNLPNNVSVVVENIPGAGWNRGLLEAWKSKPDGYTLTFINVPGNLTNQVTQAVEFDLTKMEMIGRFSHEGMIAVASKKSGLTKPEDFKGKSLKGALSGLASTGALGQLVAADALGFEQKIIQHKGPAEVSLSVVRGDADWTVLSPTAARGSIDELQPLWVYGTERNAQYPDLPTITELGHPEINVSALHRFVAAPPGTPKEILDILRTSFEVTMKDPKFVKLMEGNNSPPQYANAEESKQILLDASKNILQYKDAIMVQK